MRILLCYSCSKFFAVGKYYPCSYSGEKCPSCGSTNTQDCVIPEMTIRDKVDRKKEYRAKKFTIDQTHEMNVFEKNQKRNSEEMQEMLRYKKELDELYKQYPDVEDK